MKKKFTILAVFSAISTLSLLFITSCASNSSENSPQSYVRRTYGDRAVLFPEDADEWTSDPINENSAIRFYNSTDKEVTFEFREIKTRMNRVSSDEIRPIRGRQQKITLQPKEYFDPGLYLYAIEYPLFVFEEGSNLTVIGYGDTAKEHSVSWGGSSMNMNSGIGVGMSGSYQVLGALFEITEK
ncbi:MAG: hypothetical protein J6N81_11995 [Treponema sp.]|nr:hypothetical protein [Treponema sp.]